jgi:hypothetical protein
MSCDNCDDAYLNLRIQALRLAVEASSISHKVDFEALADRYFVWLSKPSAKAHKKTVKKQLT